MASTMFLQFACSDIAQIDDGLQVTLGFSREISQFWRIQQIGG